MFPFVPSGAGKDFPEGILDGVVEDVVDRGEQKDFIARVGECPNRGGQ